MKKSCVLWNILVVLALVMTLSVLCSACDEPNAPSGEEQESFRYLHDPRDNPSAMADIVVDEHEE